MAEFELGLERARDASAGGFIFGPVGWSWAQPQPKSITFMLDGTTRVCDQYGRLIVKAVLGDREVLFATATHAQVIAALAAERIDWQATEVHYVTRDGGRKSKVGLSPNEAKELQERLVKEGCTTVLVTRTISCAGWPQLPYDQLKKLPELPPTPIEELRKIRDPQLRKDALRIRRESDEVRAKELAVAAEE